MSTPIDCPEGQQPEEQPTGEIACVVIDEPTPGPVVPDCPEGQQAEEQSTGIVCVTPDEPTPGPVVPDCPEGQQAQEQTSGEIACVATAVRVVQEAEPVQPGSTSAVIEQAPTPQPMAELPATGSESALLVVAVGAVALGGALMRLARIR